MEIYTLDIYKTTESLVIKGFSAIQNLLRHNLGFQNCIKDGKNIERIIQRLIQFNEPHCCYA